MPPLAAAGAAIASAASAVTLTGLATGAAIVGTGAQLIGMATGSKTMQKIGMGFSMASGVGFAANGARGLMAASSVTGTASKSKGLMADNIDDMLTAPTKGTTKTQGFSNFKASGGQTSSMDKFSANSKLIGANPAAGQKPMGGFDPELEKSYFERANQTLTQYNPLMGMVGGMGEAYMMNERMDLERELLDKRQTFDQQLIDRVAVNNGTPLNIDQSIGLSRNTNAFGPLLRR